MKPVFLFMLCSLLILSHSALAQTAEDSLIRRLEMEEREAIHKGDTVKLAQLMSAQIVVQNPENTIVGYRQIMERIRQGKINYARFGRTIENIAFFNNTAVVMGVETIVPQGAHPQAGKTIKRRFTNMWIKESGQWQLAARQSTIVSVQ